MARIDFSRIPEIHAAARRARAEEMGRFIARAFAWLIHRKPAEHGADTAHLLAYPPQGK